MNAQFPWLRLYQQPEAHGEEQRSSLERDKAYLAAMAQQWREQRQRRAEAAFQQWKADRHAHAVELFAKIAEDREGFPPPSHHR